MIRNRHAMDRARPIFQHVGRAAKRRFGIDHPLSVLERGQELLPRLGGSQGMTVARPRQAALRMILAEPGQEETPKHPTQHADWEEEGGAARQPLGPIRGQPASGNHTVEMGMMVQGLAPGMQHREEADVRAEMPRIVCHSQEGLGHGLEQTRRQGARVLQHSWAQSMRQREHHMEGGALEELRFAGSEPRRLRAALTLGAMPMTTGIVGVLGVVTVVTLRQVASQGGRPAGRNGPQDPPLLGRDSRALGGCPRISVNGSLPPGFAC